MSKIEQNYIIMTYYYLKVMGYYYVMSYYYVFHFLKIKCVSTIIVVSHNLQYFNVTLHLMFTVNWKYYGVAVPSEYNITKYVFINIIKSQYILGSLQCK